MSEGEIDVRRARVPQASFRADSVGIAVGAILARREVFYRSRVGLAASFLAALILGDGGSAAWHCVSNDPQKESKQVRRAGNRVRRVKDVMIRGCVEKGSSPQSLSRIGNIVSCVDLRENELNLVSMNNRLMIISAVPDGKFDTNDDVRGESAEKRTK